MSIKLKFEIILPASIRKQPIHLIINFRRLRSGQRLRQICNGAHQFQNAVMGARRQIELTRAQHDAATLIRL